MSDLSFGRLPFTYAECRARFRHAAANAGAVVDAHPVPERGPDGQELTVDVVSIGEPGASRLLVVLSGVHGVEGFINSVLQTDLVERVGADGLPAGVEVLLVHVVNPWGMAWWRRQNESNVDLNRNFRRDEIEPVHNDAYDEIHHVACPDTPDLPDVAELLVQAQAMVEERGLPWVRNAITAGQYRHPDGLHYGGERTEASSRIVQDVGERRIVGRDRVFVLDLHTGHGPWGEITLLCDTPPGDPHTAFLERSFEGVIVEATVGNPDATTGPKSGQIANGIRRMLPEGTCVSTCAEFGTANDLEQLRATYLSQWVHRRGDRSNPTHAAAIWDYRCCFTPDDREWERAAFARGQALLDQAVAAVAAWT
jgi:predicted deacylase